MGVFMVRFLVLLSFLVSQVAGAAVLPSGVPSVGYGINTAANQGPAISASDVTKYYSAACGFGVSNVTSGNYYKCTKQAGAGGDWQVANGKTAYCQGFYFDTNALQNIGGIGITYGYGTAATAGNTSSAPTGAVDLSPGGNTSTEIPSNANYGQRQWIAQPVQFSTTGPGASIFPFLKASGGGSYVIVTFICQDI